MRCAITRYEASHQAMGTEFSLVAYGDDPQYLAAVGDEVFEEIDRLEGQMSIYNPRSELSVINRMAASRSVCVEPALFELLVKAVDHSQSTGGAFDVTAGPLMKAWGFFRGKGRVPPDFEIDDVLRRVGSRNVHLNRAERTIRFDVEGLELDLGAIGKGHAVDRAIDTLRSYGIKRALVSSGTSSLYALGAPPGARGWLVSLRNPYDSEKAANVVYLRNCSLSTSGNYEKFFTLGAKTYAHIIDPRTGKPAENMLAAVVLAPSACDADTLSTAFYVMGVERTRDYLATHRELLALFYLSSGTGRQFRRVMLRSARSGRMGAFFPRDPERKGKSTRKPTSRSAFPSNASVLGKDFLRRFFCYYVVLGSVMLIPTALLAQNPSPLAAAGYAVLPVPQKVTLTGKNFALNSGWQLQLETSVKENDVAVESLKDGLATKFHLSLAAARAALSEPGVIRLGLKPNSVEIGQATDRDKSALAEQAYRLTLSPKTITVAANAAPGLFYGVQTLLQLFRRREESLSLPEGEILDWPDLQLRAIYWDDAHHLERLQVLKEAVRQAAFFKINGFAIKLEGHFQYKSAPAIVEPYAMTPSELQELTDYALRHHVQLIPYLDAPGHVAFILKHPEYAALRAFADSNYEFCVTNPETYKLLFAMYNELLAATKGSNFFILSTDEPYYVGMASSAQCEEAARARELGSVGKLLAEFVTKAATYLHDKGRTVWFWGEYPLTLDDVPSLPSHLVNGEVHGNDFDSAFKKRGIRQLVYTSTEGEEPLFPDYYILPSTRRLHPKSPDHGRVTEMFNRISFTSARQQSDLMGTIVAGWADAGLHPETFWLGYTTGPSAAWHPAETSPSEVANSFYELFYGPEARNVGRLYQLMSEQAQVWDDTWEEMASSARTPIWGNSDKIFIPPRPADDQTLPLLPVPSAGNLAIGHDWKQENSRRLEIATTAVSENDELLDLLYANLGRVRDNQYTLEVFLSITGLYRHNLEMILDLGEISDRLKTAQAAAGNGDVTEALAALDEALNTAVEIQRRRNRALQDATTTWYKTWFPRVAEANGRRYLDQVDDVKDHRPVRTVDMSYLVYRELLYPLGDWAARTLEARNEYARAHQLPVRTFELNWKDTTAGN